MLPEHQRLIDRLNAILMVTKSCTRDSCRDPWSALQPPGATARVASLTAALAPEHDSFYAALPRMHFGSCMAYQGEANEQPFYPAGAEDDLGKAYRRSTDNWVSTKPGKPGVPPNAEPAGGEDQRHATIGQLFADTHVLADEEMVVAGGDGTTEALTD